jgi:hypothetical protein
LTPKSRTQSLDYHACLNGDRRVRGEVVDVS